MPFKMPSPIYSMPEFLAPSVSQNLKHRNPLNSRVKKGHFAGVSQEETSREELGSTRYESNSNGAIGDLGLKAAISGYF
jgi:hypothetical protein